MCSYNFYSNFSCKICLSFSSNFSISILICFVVVVCHKFLRIARQTTLINNIFTPFTAKRILFLNKKIEILWHKFLGFVRNKLQFFLHFLQPQINNCILIGKISFFGGFLSKTIYTLQCFNNWCPVFSINCIYLDSGEEAWVNLLNLRIFHHTLPPQADQ